VLTQEVIDDLDSGVREMVLYLDEHGFDTCDSGDGSKVGFMGCALDFPHVIAQCTRDNFFQELDRLGKVMEPFMDSWFVQGSCVPGGGVCTLEVSQPQVHNNST